MKYYIKNMVCNRCKMMVKSELEKLGLHPVSVSLGEVDLTEELQPADKVKLAVVLESLGFAMIDDKKSRVIGQIKTLIIELVHYNDNELRMNLSYLLSERLHLDYNYMSNLFSEIESTTIEKYFIAQKVERVKELLVYDELTLSEIAFKLNYSSVAYLSSQFKKITGLTPSHFKNIRTEKRKSLDEL
ncbi:AraC family transcriptional regulator [Dysgonomonas sp. HDW5B]|uniref:AraC family transcriptional regulator n=1 Tax=Dysgonomonas sp. HDW5B TaxID=2714927 RepID=UPI001629679E|nr:AraC family transcriptional regulator [Dysgonomonas sp. HDW5B]